MSLPGQDAHVVELRVPGLVGLTGERLLDTVSTVTVDGDESARVVRPSDRLRRPIAGPMLQALRRSVPRTLEGYLWHKMTSGGPAKALWALLFPFALANVAQGMLPAAPRESRSAVALDSVLCAVLRVVGLLLTILFITQLGVISFDLIAAGCLADTSAQARCFGFGSAMVGDHELVRMTVGLVPLLALVALLHRLSALRWVAPEEQRFAPAEDQQPDLPGNVLLASPNARVLRGLHTLAALASIALLPIGGPFTVPEQTGRLLVWASALGALGLALLAVALLDDRVGWLRTVFSRPALPALLGLAAVLVLVASAYRLPLRQDGQQASVNWPSVTGAHSLVEGILATLLAGCITFAVLLVPYAVLARRDWRDLPRRLRPWLGGWAAAPTLVLASLTGAGFGAGLTVALRELVADRTFALPDSYDTLTVLWAVGTILALLCAVVTYGVSVRLRLRIRGIPDIVRRLHQEDGQRRQAAAAWATAIIERKHLHRLVSALVLIMATGGLALVVLRFADLARPAWVEPLSAFGVVALGLLAAGLLRIVYTAARSPERHRHLGALADLVYFWPRKAHPFVPPSYALKVVPDLAERARLHLEEPSNRVVISGYSHGGLLAVLAAGRLLTSIDESARARVGLLTAGTPLQWGYQRAFPALLPQSSLAHLYGLLHGRWRGLCRGTDPFGGGVTTWRHQIVGDQLLGVGYLRGGGVGPLPAAEQSQTSALVLGGDHWLPDPVPARDNNKRWAPGVLGHSDYLIDEEWDRAVAMAAGLERPGGSGGCWSEQSGLPGAPPSLGQARR